MAYFKERFHIDLFTVLFSNLLLGIKFHKPSVKYKMMPVQGIVSG
ncbi:MAG: hypothetical protein ACI9XO_001013 [Paraglaciecola sp.]|jgi:hypothetical protein